MLVYYFVPFIVSNRYLLFCVSNGHNSVTVQNRAHVYMNFFDHKDLGNHLLQLCPKVVKHPVYKHTHTHTHTHTRRSRRNQNPSLCMFCTHTNTKPKFGFLKIDFVKEGINSCFFPWVDDPMALGLLVMVVSISPSNEHTTLSRTPLDK